MPTVISQIQFCVLHTKFQRRRRKKFLLLFFQSLQLAMKSHPQVASVVYPGYMATHHKQEEMGKVKLKVSQAKAHNPSKLLLTHKKVQGDQHKCEPLFNHQTKQHNNYKKCYFNLKI